MEERTNHRLKEVIALFLRLGFTAFGGPAAHIGIMHDEVVKRRKWVDDQRFLDLLGATNLIPGPNSTEMVIHLSFLRSGWAGLVLGGMSFILPAMLIVLGLSWAYVEYGSTPAAEWLLYGVKPVVIAIIGQALWSLGRKAVQGLSIAVVGAAVFVLYFLGVNEIVLLFGGGLVVVLVERLRRGGLEGAGLAVAALWQGGILRSLAGLTAPIQQAAQAGLGLLFWTFLKIGSVLYGSGYVLLAFLRSDFVVRYGLLTDQQLIDAVAIGQVTPGPVFTTATFVGYVLGGVPGAVVSTVGIFLPSFVFVALSGPLIPRLRQSLWAGLLLDGVNASALGLMAAVTVVLALDAFVDPLTVALGLGATALLFRYRVNSTWLIAAGALVGLLASLVR